MVARLSFIAALVLIAPVGCSSGARQAAPNTLPPLVRPATSPVSSYIKHVIVIVQENRSFENFFAGYPGADAPTYGYAINHNHKKIEVTLHQDIFQTNPNLGHNWSDAVKGWDNGKMDDFWIGPGKNYAAYAYIEHSQILPYWQMAQQYVLADAMFPTEFGGSYTAHLNLVAGNDEITTNQTAEVNYPTNSPDDCDSPPGTTSSLVTASPYRQVGRGNGPFPCFTQFNSMANDLDTGGISWKYYVNRKLNAGIWSPYEAISYVRYGSDWNTDIIAPETLVLKDPKKNQLADVSWVTPSHEDSDHPGAHSDRGPSWVSSVVNAIGQSSYWNSSAIIVVWDDWGGWYDDAAPNQLDFRGLGQRVPCLIISPYAKSGTSSKGYVDHTQYEFGSILAFIEQAFNLPNIGPASEGYTDARATSISDAFDFYQSPRKFQPFKSKYPASLFLHEPPSNQPVDNQ
jgi:phospholipase C